MRAYLYPNNTQQLKVWYGSSPGQTLHALQYLEPCTNRDVYLVGLTVGT